MHANIPKTLKNVQKLDVLPQHVSTKCVGRSIGRVGHCVLSRDPRPRAVVPVSRVRTRRAYERPDSDADSNAPTRHSFDRASVDDGDDATRALGVRAMSRDARVLRRERGADGDRVGRERREIGDGDDLSLIHI